MKQTLLVLTLSLLLKGTIAIKYKNILIDDDMDIVIKSPHVDSNNIHGRLGSSLKLVEPEPDLVEEANDGITITWFNQARLFIQQRETSSQFAVSCQDVAWVADDCRQDSFQDCYSLSGSHWYGGAPVAHLNWPIEKWSIDYMPYTTRDAIDTFDSYGNIQERYWLNSNGDAFIVETDVPLWLSLNGSGSQEICFRSTYNKNTDTGMRSPYINYDDSVLYLNYTICQGANMMETHRYVIDSYLGKPTDIPDETLFRFPIYSTWARYHEDVNQSLVMEYAQEIVSHDYSNAQMEIDDDWEITYGRLDFNPDKFPDPASMVSQLSDMGFRTTLWIHPFTNIDTDDFWIGGLQFVFLKDLTGVLPSLTAWWNGMAGIVDLTDPDSVSWWTDRLLDLQTNYGIDSFKFDAGEASYLPASYKPYIPFRNPSEYTRLYAETAYSMDPVVRHQEVRVGWRTQHLPIFVRIMDKFSGWGYDNGLKTVIPHIILFSVMGYVFPLPDMIGGNAYFGEFPDRELFIRWTAVNVFLPAFQFSIVPWQYDQQTTDICRDMLTLHEQYADLMIELARNATVTGEPIIRPLWWVNPSDPVAQVIDSEFLVGNDLLVAPVVDPGVTSRDVYLPAGRWRDMNNPIEELDGGMWHYSHPAPLDVLPYFTRIQ